MSKQSITQISLKANEELVKKTKRQWTKGFWMVGKQTWVETDKATKQWELEGMDFLDVFYRLGQREQRVVMLLKDGIKWDNTIGCFNFVVPVTKDSDLFESMYNGLRYDEFLRGYQTLHKQDLVRRVSSGKYMMNPEFFVPSNEQAMFAKFWSEAKQHKSLLPKDAF